MKKICIVILILLTALLAGCAGQTAGAPMALAPDPELPGTPHAVSGSIVVRGFEWGPGVPKVIIELDRAVDGVLAEDARYTCRGERTVTDVYLSDTLGFAVSG